MQSLKDGGTLIEQNINLKSYRISNNLLQNDG